MMKRLVMVLLSFACGLSATVFQPGASARDREVWLHVKSQHFTIIGNADERTIRQVALRLEQFRAAVVPLFHQTLRRPAPPVTVIVFKNDAAYRPFKPLYQGQPAPVAGYFQASDDAAYITLAADGQHRDPYAVIFHEYVHLLMSGAMRQLPTCLSEGIAEYYSTFALGGGDRRIWVGRAIESHVRLLRAQSLLPLTTLFAVNQASPFYNEGDKKNLFYAQAWALVHYLMLGDEGRRQPQLRQFINALAAGQPLEQSFRQAFQTDYAGLENELREYLQRKFYPAQQVMLAEKLVFDATVQTSIISEAEAQGYLGDLLCRIERVAEGEALLQEALARDPQSATAQMALGMLRMRQERFREAAPHFQQAAQTAPQNYLAHYYHAYALQHAQADEFRYIAEFPDETVRTMRAALNQSRTLAPEFADTYRLLAFINLVRNENLEESVALLTRALELAPQRAEFIYTLAQVHMRRQDYAAALRAAERLTGNEAKPELRNRARAMIETITQAEEQLARAKAEAARGDNSTAASSTPAPLPGKRFVGAQVRGLLVRIDCTETHLTLTVRSDEQLFRFQTALGKLIFVRYTMEIPNEITCGALTPARPVIVTYQPPGNIRARIDGTPIGVEFIKPETE